jgi:hypothetical protein
MYKCVSSGHVCTCKQVCVRVALCIHVCTSRILCVRYHMCSCLLVENVCMNDEAFTCVFFFSSSFSKCVCSILSYIHMRVFYFVIYSYACVLFWSYFQNACVLFCYIFKLVCNHARVSQSVHVCISHKVCKYAYVMKYASTYVQVCMCIQVCMCYASLKAANKRLPQPRVLECE